MAPAVSKAFCASPARNNGPGAVFGALTPKRGKLSARTIIKVHEVAPRSRCCFALNRTPRWLRSSPPLGATTVDLDNRSITLVKSSVMLLGQYDTWSVSRPNMPPFRACEHASSAVLHGSPETLIPGNGHTCPKCEPTRARPNCSHGPLSTCSRAHRLRR